MNIKPILLIGAGGHTRACIDVIEQEGRFKVAGLVGLSKEVGKRVLDYPVLGTDADIPELLSDYPHALITIGQIKSVEHRICLYNRVTENGGIFPVIRSPRAFVSPHAQIGDGTIVMHGAVVNAGARIGSNCILNSQSLVEHDCIIADHCHISTATVINSSVHIGTGTFIGSNSSVRQCIRIGDYCVIGMGQRVLSDCETGSFITKTTDRT